MRILVTGSNGLLGQKLTELLNTDPSNYLIATAKGSPIIPVKHGEFVSMDITNHAQVNDVVAKTKPDVIIHGAAMTNVDQCESAREECWAVNVTSVENLIKICKENDIHLVHVSTDFIFDGTKELLDESAEPCPVNYYGESKLAAEKAIQDSDISWAILRTVLVFGITAGVTRSNIVLWVKNNLQQGKTINVVTDQWRTLTLSEDLAQGCFLAATKKAKGIYNICGKDYLSIFDIAVRVANFFKLDKSLMKPADSSNFSQPARRPLKTGFVIEKARKDLGYEPHSFEEGLALMVTQLKLKGE